MRTEVDTPALRKHIVIIGGGPAGTTCATHAARLGAKVTLIERDLVGGAAHLLDCIPSKAMIATGGAMAMMNDAAEMGLAKVDVLLDFEALRNRIQDIEDRLEASVTDLLASQGVRLLEGTGRLLSEHQVEVFVQQRWQRTVARRRDRAQHREPPPHPRLGRGRRPPGPDHARRLPTPRAPGPPGGGRLRRDRGGVRAHVQLLRFRRDPDRLTPAGAAKQGPGGRGRAGTQLPRPRRAVVHGSPSRGHRSARARRRGALRRRSDRQGHPCAAGHRVDPQLRRPRAGEHLRRGRVGLRQDRPQLPVQRAPHLRRR